MGDNPHFDGTGKSCGVRSMVNTAYFYSGRATTVYSRRLPVTLSIVIPMTVVFAKMSGL
jgi:hypothetical protein